MPVTFSRSSKKVATQLRREAASPSVPGVSISHTETPKGIRSQASINIFDHMPTAPTRDPTARPSPLAQSEDDLLFRTRSRTGWQFAAETSTKTLLSCAGRICA